MKLLFIILLLISSGTFGQAVTEPSTFVDIALFKQHDLQSTSGKKESILSNFGTLGILVFLSPECPLSINYTKTLTELAATFKGKSTIIGIVPGKSYSLNEIKNFSKDYKLNFKVYIDPDKTITHQVGATVTPEVILFAVDGKIIYRGAIDDWAIALGKKKQKATNLYLQNAIQAHLQGNIIAVKNTKPVGCLINDF